MKIIIGMTITIDLEDVKSRLIENPVQRLKDCLKIETWIEKKR